MRFNGLDLNLLVALNALMTERNLSAAARSINLSQPAMSAAAERLRSVMSALSATSRLRSRPLKRIAAAPIHTLDISHPNNLFY